MALTARSLPTDLHGLVRLQHASPLPHRAHPIRTIAGTLSMSERTLQRWMAEQCLSYSQVLAEVRLQQAVDWLENTDKPIGEIAFDLG